MITVKVPATSANMGPGFDCIGVALALYNMVSVEETDSGLIIDIEDETKDYLPTDSKNLVYRSMQTLFNMVGYKCRGLHIIQRNEIPVTRGLGSSSASIVGGLFAANEICKAGFSRGDLISVAANLEGHPDNTTPAITGGMAVAAIDKEKTYYQKIAIDGSKLKFAVFVPDFILRTKKARNVLPQTIPHSDGVFNTARAALLTASLITGNYDNLKTAFNDKLHQQYRKHLIKGIDSVFDAAEGFGALGTYISGAGPAIISLIEAKDEESFSDRAKGFLSQELKGWDLLVLKPDNNGALII